MAALRKIFSNEQMARYRRVFDLCDRNKNGVLEGRELAAMAHVMGYGFDKDQVAVSLTHTGLLLFGKYCGSEVARIYCAVP